MNRKCGVEGEKKKTHPHQLLLSHLNSFTSSGI